MLKQPKNSNYAGTIVSIKNIIPLENCDNICHTNIFGNLIIINKATLINECGVFFPVECALSKEFLSNNNLYRESTLNIDNTKKGFFETSGRIRCLKLRNYKSMGIFLPISCLDFTQHKELLQIGDSFDEINNIKICEKYIINNTSQSSQSKNNKRNNKLKRFEDKILGRQFNFHIDTNQLGKNIFKLVETDLISITTKLHGTSGISSNILCKRKLNLIEKLLKLFSVKIEDKEYSNIYASRNVIKNNNLNSNSGGFYKEDIWNLANNKLKEHLQKGLTFYYEIVGYLPSGSYIQKPYDYGCNEKDFDIYIYRITYTNPDGLVYEFSMKQLHDFCNDNDLKAVPLIYYGTVANLYSYLLLKYNESKLNKYDCYTFLDMLQKEYLEKDSAYCNNKLPEEGIVLRLEKNYIESYKLKSFRFLELETKNLDEGEVDIEDIN